MDGKHFSKKIKDTIEIVSHDFFYIKQDINKECVCINHTTKQEDKICPHCLNTGHKITIKKIRGFFYEETKSGQGMRAEQTRVIRNYFIPDTTIDFHTGDYFIDSGEVYYIYRPNNFRGVGFIETHQEVLTAFQQNNQKKLLNTFNEILLSKVKDYKALKEKFPWLK